MENLELSFISIAEACRRLGDINPSTFYRGVKRGVYPAPVKIGLKKSGVPELEFSIALKAMLDAGRQSKAA